MAFGYNDIVWDSICNSLDNYCNHYNLVFFEKRKNTHLGLAFFARKKGLI